MKKSLADRIEEYIKVLIARSGVSQIEIQRAELARTFSCVPSQVTYVVSTRFTEEAGYITESRRGGKGFIRISYCDADKEAALESKQDLFVFIDRLSQIEIISQREAEMLKYVINQSAQAVAYEQRSRIFDAFKYALADFLGN